MASDSSSIVTARTACESAAAASARLAWFGRVVGYGWAPILIGAMAMTATYPGRTHGLGMVTEPLLNDFGLATPAGRVFYASLNFWATLIGALFCIPVGWLFDRYDRRAILAGNLILLGAAVVWMATLQNWQGLVVALVLTRGFGQSALSVVSLTIVAKSFEPHRLGLAMAWYAILAMPLHLGLIQGVGWALAADGSNWRAVWGGIGIVLIALAGFAACLPREPAALERQANAEEPGSTLVEALRTPAFWLFSLTIAIWGMIYAGVALFNVDIFKERGFNSALYFNVLSLVTLIGLASKLVFGWLVNYVPLNRLLSVCLLVTALSLAGLPLATQPWHAYAYGVGLGIASGAVALLFFATWGKLFGRRELGRIQGAAQMLTVFASALGPLVFSQGKLLTSSYTAVFQLFAGLVLAMALVAWLVPASVCPTQENDKAIP